MNTSQIMDLVRDYVGARVNRVRLAESRDIAAMDKADKLGGYGSVQEIDRTRTALVAALEAMERAA